jgi:hypothetical protein
MHSRLLFTNVARFRYSVTPAAVAVLAENMASYIEASRTNKRNQKLHTVEYKPANGTSPVAVLLFHHGKARAHCEWISRLMFHLVSLL